MGINQRQFDQLTEMGISLWHHRSSKKLVSTHSVPNITINLDQLRKIQLFNDILLSLNISIGEVNEQQGLLNLGLINWQFLDNKDKSNNESEITFDNNLLLTPSLDTLSTSITLKRQLWHIITNKIL